MSIHHRLRRLEATARVSAPLRPCPACGGPVNWREWKPDPGACRVHVIHGDAEPTGPDNCPACGRGLVIRVTHDRLG